jgi:hypothetical protein
MFFVVCNQLAEVLAVIWVGTGRGAVWGTSATPCPVDLPYVAVLVLVSGFAELRCWMLFVYTHGHLHINCTVFSKPFISGGKRFSVWNMWKMFLVHVTCVMFTAISSAIRQVQVGHFAYVYSANSPVWCFKQYTQTGISLLQRDCLLLSCVVTLWKLQLLQVAYHLHGYARWTLWMFSLIIKRP